ncbi:hypothetical protein WP1W18C01_13380 [Stenotrophomonas maltophilia]|jgi:hypothetical protein|nr:hypothetical protein WP1W18C01_13380 [Stenotrophomonas maltophilia]
MGLQVTVDCLSGHAEALGNCRAVAPLLQEAHHQGVLVSQWAPGLLTQPQVSEVGAHHGRWNAQGLGDDGPAVSLSEHPGDLRAAVGNGWPLHEPNHKPASRAFAIHASTKVFAFVHPYGPTRTRALLLSDRALMPMAQGLPHE